MNHSWIPGHHTTLLLLRTPHHTLLLLLQLLLLTSTTTPATGDWRLRLATGDGRPATGDCDRRPATATGDLLASSGWGHLRGPSYCKKPMLLWGSIKCYVGFILCTPRFAQGSSRLHPSDPGNHVTLGSLAVKPKPDVYQGAVLSAVCDVAARWSRPV